MKKPFLFLAAAAALAMPFLHGPHGRLYAAEAGAAAKESCVTAKCHAKMGKDKFIHGPVAAGECESCHIKTDKHKFEPITDVGKVCSQCHELPNTKKHVHPPVMAGNCTGCHSPHQSPYKYQLKAEPPDLCFLCHDKSMAGGKYVHGPVAAGECTTCHNVHQSDFPKMLMANGNEVCFTCHPDKADAAKSAKFTHPPVADTCTNCHSPHSANYQYNLSADGSRDLCFTCHADKEKDIKEATVPHKALAGERKCLTCHDPHFASYPKQLLKQPAELCLGCHDKDYPGPDGQVETANIKTILEKTKDHHGPIREGDCSACHNPHGSKNFRMLREYFPPLFYASYNPDNYKLCFMCHEKTLASTDTTSTLTNFRNGTQNLHFVHVNKQVKGRTCRACHDPHGTNNPKHIRDKVPFAKWELPVNYTKTPNGGSCMPGCHKRYTYDRIKPVANKTGH